ncbi:MAG: hypothetical protein RIQ53_448 [Pseudomonadota bacterium]
MKIAILGAGALGCAFGASLIEAGQDVWLITRTAGSAQRLRGDGLRVDDACGSRVLAVQACAGEAVAAAAGGPGPVDLVVVLVKSGDTAAAMAQARALVGAGTAVLSLQNGLGHEDLLAGIVGRGPVLAGKTYVGGVRLGLAHIRSGVPGKATLIGELDGRRSARVQRIAEVFNAAGLATEISADIVATMWDKLFVNVATGALAAITRLPYGPLYDEPLLADTAQAAVAEAQAVARAAGVAIGPRDPAAVWALARAGLGPDFRTSMLQSLDQGARTEIDVINGAVVRHGRRLGVATPVNATLVACIKGIERGRAEAQAQAQAQADTAAPAFVSTATPAASPAPAPAACSREASMRDTPPPADIAGAPATTAYLEHVAVFVRDIHWHIRFFAQVLGLTLREIDGPPEAPRQYWTLGGLQLIAAPEFDGPEGRLAHLGVMCADLEAALAAAAAFGVTALPQGRHWLRLPDGLAVELIQACPANCVDRARAIDPRAGA